MQISSVLRWSLLALPLIACSCDDSSGDCHAQSDCERGEVCLGPNDWSACGIPPQEDCADDGGCPGQTCHAIGDSCSMDGTGSRCGPPCNDNCGQGYRCNAGGACEAVPCDEGFTCPAHQACDPTSVTATDPVYDRHHGCVDITCGGDGDCPADLVCVNSFCQEGAGSCREPQQVP